ncbi:MAG TPA: IS1634 family transposase [Pyrinomonadaceae bacterium]
MYLRITERRNRDGSTVAYYALAENAWNAETKRSETRVVHSFGRADRLDRDALKRLVQSINRVLDAGEAGATTDRSALPEIEIERVYEWGVVLAARHLWDDLGIAAAIQRCAAEVGLSAPHEPALFAMAAQRLDVPGSKLACAERWLPERTWLPEAAGLKIDQFYRALDFLAMWADAIEREVFLRAADLFRLDVDLIFYDTTTAYFEIDEADEQDELWAGRLFAPLRRRGHSKEGRDNQPQVIIALAVTRDGMPVRSWVLPGDTADVATVARIKEDLRAWRLGRCVFVGDAGMYSADNLAALSQGLGRYILAVPMRRVKEVGDAVLKRPGRYKPVADNLQVKEVWVGEGERRRRYVLCLNTAEAERQRQHREAVLAELDAELALLAERDEDHPKAACTLLASRRYGRYLSTDWRGRPRLDAAKVKAAAAFDGKFVITSNDDSLSAADLALGYKGYKGAWIIESCFRRMKQTGLAVRPMFHWSPRRIVAHVKLCILALQVQRAAEIRCAVPWARIAAELATLKAVRYRTEERTIVQRTKITEGLAQILKKLGVSTPKQILRVAEPPPPPGA